MRQMWSRGITKAGSTKQYRQQRNGGKLNGAQDLHDLSSVGPAAKHDK